MASIRGTIATTPRSPCSTTGRKLLALYLTHCRCPPFEHGIDIGKVNPHRPSTDLLVVQIPYGRGSCLGIFEFTEAISLWFPCVSVKHKTEANNGSNLSEYVDELLLCHVIGNVSHENDSRPSVGARHAVLCMRASDRACMRGCMSVKARRM